MTKFLLSKITKYLGVPFLSMKTKVFLENIFTFANLFWSNWPTGLTVTERGSLSVVNLSGYYVSPITVTCLLMRSLLFNQENRPFYLWRLFWRNVSANFFN